MCRYCEVTADLKYTCNLVVDIDSPTDIDVHGRFVNSSDWMQET